MSEDPIHRGKRWALFYDEAGGLKDMLATIKGTYLERLAAVDPANVDQLQVLALAHKVTVQLEGMVQAVISTGTAADAAREWTSKMQAIPAAKRRYL